MTPGSKFLGGLGNLFSELGLASMATQDPSAVAITGGSVSGVAGSFTSLAASLNVTATGYHQSNRTGAQYIAPGYMHYSDTNNFYMLLTGTQTPTTTFNSLRPFNINLASGLVGMNNGASVTGGLTVDTLNVTASFAGGNAIQVTGAGTPTLRAFNTAAPGPSGGAAGRYLEHYVDANGMYACRFVNGAYSSGPSIHTVTSDANSNPLAHAFFGTSASFGSMPVTMGVLTAAGVASASQMVSSGATAGFSASDRSTSGSFVLYRDGGLNRLYDSTFGDVARFSSTTTTLLQPVSMSGTLTTASTILSGGEVQSTSNNSYRIVAGNYGTFWRNDGANLYLMMTASGSQYGSWNSLRPFIVNVATGAVQMQAGVQVSAGLTTDTLSVSGSASFGGAFAANLAANPSFGSAVTGGAVGIELGSQSTAGAAYLDFHSSGTTTDYDARLYVSGGSATAGGGVAVFTAASLTVTGTLATNGYLAANNGASLGTYGSLSVAGSKAGYSGVHFNDAGRTFMVQNGVNTQSGVWNASTGWEWMWTGGTLSTGTVPMANVAQTGTNVPAASAAMAATDVDRDVFFNGGGYTLTLPTGTASGWKTGVITNLDPATVGTIAPPSGMPLINDGVAVASVAVAMNQRVYFVNVSGTWRTQWVERSPIVMVINAAAGTATLDFRMPAGYQAFEVHVANVVPSVNNSDFGYILSANAGSTFKNGASDYGGAYNASSSTATAYITMIVAISNTATYTGAEAAMCNGFIDTKYGAYRGNMGAVIYGPSSVCYDVHAYQAYSGTAITPNLIRFLAQSGTFSANGFIRGIPAQ